MKLYFYKEIVSSAFLVGGKAVPFEQLDGNRGVITLESDAAPHQELISALEKAASEHRFGVVKITPEEYTEKKSQYPFVPSKLPQTDMLRVMPTDNSPFKKGVPAVEVGSKQVSIQEQMETQMRILGNAKKDTLLGVGDAGQLTESVAEAAPVPVGDYKPATGRASNRAKAEAAA